MSQKANIEFKDKFSIDHKHLLEGFNLTGLAGLYHEPRLGITLLISEDKPFSAEWHEGAHHFISQRSVLGFVLSALSNALWVLILALITEQQFQLKNILSKLHMLRENLIERFVIPHEIYAISSEAIAIVENIRDGKVFNNLNLESIRNSLDELERRISRNGNEAHLLSLYWMEKLSQKIPHVFFIPKLISAWSMNILLFDFLDVSPLKYESMDKRELSSIIPDPISFFEWIKENENLIHPGSLMEQSTELSIFLNKYMNSKKFQEWIQNKKLGIDWYNGLKSICGVTERSALLFENATLLNFKHLFLNPIKRTRFEKQASYDKINDKLSPEDSRQFKELWERVITSFPHSKSNFNTKKILLQDDLYIPPPLTLTFENNVLTLNIREDIKTDEALTYIAIKLVDIPFTEMAYFDIEQPIICMQSFCTDAQRRCRGGLGECTTSRMLYNLYKSRKMNSGLICLRNNEVRILETAELGKKNPSIYTHEFDIKSIPFEPKGFAL